MCTYSEGDFLVIRDEEKANQSIAMSSDIEEGVVVKIKHIRSGMFICEKEEPPRGTEIEPYPQTAGIGLIAKSDGQVDIDRADDRMADQDLASELSKYYSNNQTDT